MPPQPGLPVHDHDCGEGDCGLLYSLYKEIDLPKKSFADTTSRQRLHVQVEPAKRTVFTRGRTHDSAADGQATHGLSMLPGFMYMHVVACLNEHSEGSCRSVLKTWDQRTNFSGEPLKSCLDDDAELLLHIPFDGEVKIKAISIIGGPEGSSPASVKLFANRESLDFGTAQDLTPTQEFTLNEDFRGILEYPVTIAKFQGVHTLDMLFPASMGADHLEVFFVGIKGERTQRRREIVQAVYELKPMADASKIPGLEHGSHVGM